MRPRGLRGIIWCHFSAYLKDGLRRWMWWRLIVFLAAPMAVGLLLASRIGHPKASWLPLIVAVYSVLAAVLVGLIPLVHSVIGQCDSVRTYESGERPLAEQEIDRIQTLQDLHAAISYATILLVVALGTCLVLVFTVPPAAAQSDTARVAAWLTWIQYVSSAIVYTVGVSTAMTFFDVATGVFEAMESHAESLKRRIRNNIQRDS